MFPERADEVFGVMALGRDTTAFGGGKKTELPALGQLGDEGGTAVSPRLSPRALEVNSSESSM